jgi:hypothetical protein
MVELLSLLLLTSRAETAVERDVVMAAGHASRQGACTGWFPAVVTGSPVSVPKRPPSCENFGGRRWVRTTGFSLVSRMRISAVPTREDLPIS